jgi:[methyl-Co(III) methanol-specific corrinoid protein]:coenzyme M methyltransferase
MKEKMTGREVLLNVLQGKPADRLPVMSVCQYATYELMDAAGAAWPEAHRDAQLMAALSGAGASILGLDAVRAPYCQTVEAEAFGAVVKEGGKTHIPSIARHPYTFDDCPSCPADFLTRGRIPTVLEAVRIMKAQLGEHTAVMGGIGGPFSIANSLVGITPFLKAMFKKPETIIPLLEAGYEAALTLGEAFIAAGADIIVVEDMMASLDMISPKNFRTMAAPYEKRLIEKLSVPVILHICGKLDKVMPDIAATGAAAISVESAVDIPAVRTMFAAEGITTPIAGDINPSGVLLSGTPDEVRAAVRNAVSRGVSIISPGCAVAPGTPLANLRAMVEEGRRVSQA